MGNDKRTYKYRAEYKSPPLELQLSCEKVSRAS